MNLIVYANYGEPNARIIHGHDHDFDDIRSQEHNRFIEQRIQALAAEARSIIEEKEQRLVMRVKAAIRDYYYTKNETAKQEFEEANGAYPFLFSRAWRELKDERARFTAVAEPPASTPIVAAPRAQPLPEAQLEMTAPLDVVYPLDPELREDVLEIERMIEDLVTDLEALKEKGSSDDILVQTCRKLVTRARESLQATTPSDFNARRLESTRSALATTWRQVRSRLK